MPRLKHGDELRLGALHRAPDITMRQSSTARGYGRRWQLFRAAFLKANPNCGFCAKQGRQTPATVVDHITPHRGDQDLFWRRGNHQPLCASCHSRGKQTVERRGYSLDVGADGWPIDPRHPLGR